MGGAMLPDRRIGPAAEAAWGDHAATFQTVNLPPGSGPDSMYSEEFTPAETNLSKSKGIAMDSQIIRIGLPEESYRICKGFS